MKLQMQKDELNKSENASFGLNDIGQDSKTFS